ncbi:uncharacterized protein BDFB_007446, partial [Asbolus verrucosus]
FWDWFLRMSDLSIHWKNQPTYLISQFVFLFGGLATLFHDPCFVYNSSVAVAKMRLPQWAEPFAVGLGSVLIDIPYDIVSKDITGYLGILITSIPRLLQVLRFGSTLQEDIFAQVKENGFQTKGTPGGILMFLPIYHPLHDIFKIHSEVTYFIVFVMFLLIIWSADRTSKIHDSEKARKHRTHWTTWLLIVHLVLHYVSFLIMPLIFNPEDEIAIGVKEPIGPCNEYVPIQTAFGMTLQKRKFLCATDYDEKYFDWHCLKNNRPPSEGSYWYTACGVPFPNQVEIVVIISLICLVGATVYGNLHFRSSGDDTFGYKDQAEKHKKVYNKKMKKH